MSQVVPFAFEHHQVRVVAGDDGEPLFVGKDICDALGYKNPTDAMNDHCRGVAKRYPIADALGRLQDTRVLSEPDMMRLVVSSTLPSAQAFERLVFETILPSIRKTGSYLAPGVTLESLPPALASQVGGIIRSVVHKQIADALQVALPQLIEGVLAARSVGIRHGRTSGQVWKDWGLPPLKNGSLKLSRWLCDFACGEGRVEAGNQPSKLFDPDKVAKHKAVLLPLCWKYYAERKGQGGLDFGAV